MRRMVDGILNQYGTAMTLCRGEETVEVRGFFQPYRSKSWQSVAGTATALGEVPRRQYVYIGPAGVSVREGDRLTVGEREYVFRRTEHYYYGDTATYLWGLCIEQGVTEP